MSSLLLSRTLHHEAVDWAQRVIANGGVVSSATSHAVSDFCTAIDLAGVRSRIVRLNLLAGGNLASALVPLYLATSFGGAAKGSATDASYNFVDGDFAERGAAGGLKGDGVGKYLDTGLTPPDVGTLLNCHLSFSGTGIVTGTAANTGLRQALVSQYGGAANSNSSLWANDINNTGRQGLLGNFTGVPGFSQATEAHFLVSRASSTSAAAYQAGVLRNTNASSASYAAVANSFTVLATNSVGNKSAFCTARARMYSIGLSVTAAQAAAFASAVSAFNAALQR